MKNISIVSAKTKDYAEILHIMESGIAEWGGGFLDDLTVWLDRVNTPSHLAHIQTKGCLIVAVDSHGIMGTAHGYPHDEYPDVWVLGGIYVERKNLGVGKALSQHILAIGREKGYRQAHSYVHEKNYGSLRFLARQGAVPIDEERYGMQRYITLSIPLGNG